MVAKSVLVVARVFQFCSKRDLVVVMVSGGCYGVARYFLNYSGGC